jgi:hypothetical protein
MRSPARAHHKGIPPVRWMATGAAGPWDPLRPVPAFRLRDAAGACHRHRHDGVGRRTRHLPTMPVRPLLVGTPTRALAAPSELHPAGHRCALTPPYPRHRPLLQFFERSFQRCNRGYGVAAEPSSDTPVVMAPGVLSGLPGQAQCMPQAHASNLNLHQPRAGGGFRERALFSQDRRRRNYLPAMPVVRMPSQAQALQST